MTTSTTTGLFWLQEENRRLCKEIAKLKNGSAKQEANYQEFIVRLDHAEQALRDITLDRDSWKARALRAEASVASLEKAIERHLDATLQRSKEKGVPQ